VALGVEATPTSSTLDPISKIDRCEPASKRSLRRWHSLAAAWRGLALRPAGGCGLPSRPIRPGLGAAQRGHAQRASRVRPWPPRASEARRSLAAALYLFFFAFSFSLLPSFVSSLSR
jgi:hypothetical protein